MTTLPNMNLVLPTRGAPGSGLWADALDAALALLDAHDHSSGKGLRVPSAGINVNADLTFASLYAPTNLHRISFASITALAANNKSMFVSSADNELYWRSNAGTNVKLTSGTALNVAAFTGGIGGDYAAAGAALAFDDSGKRYTHKDGAANWARLASGEVRILETGTAESVYVGLAAPAALAGSYSITLPLAVPGSTSLVQMDSSGVLTASNTVANALTLAATSMTAANLISGSKRVQLKAPGGLAADYDLTMPSALPTGAAAVSISSAGVVSTDQRPYVYHPGLAVIADGGAPLFTGNVYTLGINGILYLPLYLPVGMPWSTWTVYLGKNSSAVTTVSIQLVRRNILASTSTNIGAAQTNSANAPGVVTLSGAGETVAADSCYSIVVTGGGGSNLDFVAGWLVT